MSFVQVPLFADNDVADQDRLNNIVNNLNYLNESKVTISFDAYGDTQTDRLRIATGTVDVNNPDRGYRTRWVYTSSFFTPGIRPVGLTTLASLRNRVSTIAIARRTGSTPILDHTGLQVYVRYVLNSNPLSGPNYVNWLMIGY